MEKVDISGMENDLNHYQKPLPESFLSRPNQLPMDMLQDKEPLIDHKHVSSKNHLIQVQPGMVL